MSRLYDRLMTSKSIPSVAKQHLHASVVISIDNVAEYYFANTDRIIADFSEFPNLAPPFEQFFVECYAPSVVLTPNGPCPWPQDTRAWGVDFTVQPWQDGWEMLLRLVLERRDRTYMWLLQTTLFVNADGSVLILPDDSPDAPGQPAFFADQKSWASEDNLRDAMSGVWAYYVPAFLALSFMHCKNVVQRAVRPERWQIKSAWKHNRPTPVTYHILEIEPMKKVLRYEGDIEHNGLKRALHICRGHFRTYEEKPLFGKVHGTFWIPSHVRGSLDEGIALKDYAVKTPHLSET